MPKTPRSKADCAPTPTSFAPCASDHPAQASSSATVAAMRGNAGKAAGRCCKAKKTTAAAHQAAFRIHTPSSASSSIFVKLNITRK